MGLEPTQIDFADRSLSQFGYRAITWIKPLLEKTMDLAEYHSKTHLSCVIKGENLITYMALGLAEEAGEVIEAVRQLNFGRDSNKALEELAMECGDLMWYTSECARAWGIDLANISITKGPSSSKAVTHSEWTFLLMRCVTAISGLTKKLIRDAGLVVDEERRQKVSIHLGLIVEILQEILKFGPFDLEWVMENNLAKISRRRKENTIHGDGSNR